MNNDPVDLGRKIAAFVKDNHLDGVDVDYEEVRWNRVMMILLPLSYITCHLSQFDTIEGGTVRW